MRSWLGDSRGRWEGNTLVVETTNFTPKVASFSARRGASGFEFGSGEHLRLVERFTRVDARTLQYEFTVNDPTTFTEPFTGRFPMNLTDDRSTNTRATRATTGCKASSKGDAPMNGTRRGAHP